MQASRVFASLGILLEGRGTLEVAYEAILVGRG